MPSGRYTIFRFGRGGTASSSRLMSQAQTNALVFEWQARTTPDWPVHRLIIVKAAADNPVVVDDERRIGRTGARCALALLLERAP